MNYWCNANLKELAEAKIQLKKDLRQLKKDVKKKKDEKKKNETKDVRSVQK